jgi:PPOX class probable F420-dependent enzyme
MIEPAVESFLKSGSKLAELATVSEADWPQVTPIWYLYDNGHIYMTTTPNRVKYKNIQKKPRVALFVGDPNDAYRGIEVQGKVNFIRDNLEQWNRRLAARYHPAEEVDETVRYLMSEPRVILDVTPTRVAKIGSSWQKRQSDA